MDRQNFILKDYKALGTVWYIELFGNFDDDLSEEVTHRMIQEIQDLQRKYSRFDNSSLLNVLNRDKKSAFDLDLYAMLEEGERWRKLSDGLFDIAIKNKLESIGYGISGESESVASSQDESIDLCRVSQNSDFIIWNSSQQIDLGGIGKGYLIDRLARILREEYDLQYFLINGGGDMLGTSDHGQAIEVLLEHPTEVGSYIGKIYLKDESLCASSSFKRTWKQGDTLRNHFIDTKEGSFIESASFVISSQATSTDVLATILALVPDPSDLLGSLPVTLKADYMTIGRDGQFSATERFKEGLKAL